MRHFLWSLLALVTVAASAAPRVTGNPAGGIHQDGVYKTFHSAGIYVHPEALREVPGGKLYGRVVTSLVSTELPLMTGNAVSWLLKAGLPVAQRRFFRMDEDRMNATERQRLLEVYARLVRQPVEHLTLFALTDVQTQSTYLLPSFFKLTEVEQAAVLFHEAYWILRSSADYLDVVAGEVAFQRYAEAFLKGGYDPEFPYLIGNLVEDFAVALLSAYRFDLRSGALRSLLDVNGAIRVGDLLNNEPKRCDRRSEPILICKLSYASIQHLYQLQLEHPNSYFLQELLRFVGRNGEVLFTFRDRNLDFAEVFSQNANFLKGTAIAPLKLSFGFP